MPHAAKSLALSLGLYRPARLLQRSLSRRQARIFTEDVALYRSLLPTDGALCFDVGANIGERSEALLAVGARVVAFEPQPVCASEIRARCRPYNGRLTVLQAAVGSVAGVSTLHEKAHHGSASLRAQWEGPTVGTFDVPVITLDAAIARFGRPDYVKIDVEGWECEVLAGLSHPVPLVSYEYHRGDLSAASSCAIRLLAQGGREFAVTGPESAELREWRALRDLAADPGRFLTEQYGDVFVRH